jgi:uncharacterized protein (DUF1501 family)
MNNSNPKRFGRRGFLASGLGIAGGLSLSAPAARAGALRLLGGRRRAGERTLVVIQMNGGNDGLSTLVPYGDDEYHRLRKATRIATGDLHKIDDHVGLHPSMSKLARRYDGGELGIIQGVGYPGPTLSHFKAREIWHTADLRGRAAGNGWLGKLCGDVWPDEALPELSVHIGPDVPYSLHSSTHAPVVFNTPDSYRWLGERGAETALNEGGEKGKGSVLERLRNVMSDAQDSSGRILNAIRKYETDVEYTNHKTSQSLLTAAALIHSGLGSRVISVTTGGFDTHAYQKGDHGDALKALDDGVDSFLRDVGRCEAGKETLVLAFSEFGRRAKENGSGGTDHGKAGIMFVAGTPVEGGLYGKYPSLIDLDNRDLRFNVDFRNAYATAVQWMGGDVEPVLGKDYAPVSYLS